MGESTTIKWDKGEDGIVVLTLDDPNQSANTMNAAYAASISATVDRLEAEKDDIKGVILTSAKKTFFAGGDLNDLKQATPENADEIAAFVREGKGKTQTRDIRPYVADLKWAPEARRLTASVRFDARAPAQPTAHHHRLVLTAGHSVRCSGRP